MDKFSLAGTAELTDWMFLADDHTPAEFGLLFGATAFYRCVAAGIDLYRNGAVKRLVLSGGFNPKIGREEALAMRDVALAAGVPEKDILIDDRARNTYENVANARSLIEGCSDATPFHVKLVTISYHMRRALLTAVAGMAPGTRLTCVSYASSFCRKSDWAESARGRAEIWSEIQKIARYLPPDPEAAHYLSAAQSLVAEASAQHGR